MAPLPGPFLEHRRVVISPRQSDESDESDEIPDGDSYIKLDTFLSILAATLIIFIFTVLCWKFGACVRRFTRHKVLGGGKPAAAPYAKTWYGWVPLEEEQKRSSRWREVFDRLRQRMAWRSCRADYSWVWWDPGGSKLNQHYRDHKAICWMPRCFRSYSIDQADTTWNPVRPGAELKRQSPPAAPSKQHKQKLSVVEEASSHSLGSGRSSLPETGKDYGRVAKKIKRPAIQRPALLSDGRQRITVCIPQQTQLQNKNIGLNDTCGSTGSSRGTTPWPPIRRSRSVSHTPAAANGENSSIPGNRRQRRCASDGQQNERIGRSSWPADVPLPARKRSAQSSFYAEEPTSHPVDRPANKLDLKYKAWGARMQRNGLGDTPARLRGLAGRPGTLASDALNSMISSPSNSECCGVAHMPKRQHRTQQPSTPQAHASTRNLPRFSPSLQVPLDGADDTEALQIPLTGQGARTSIYSNGHLSPSFARTLRVNNIPRRSISETLPRQSTTVITEPSKKRRAYSGSEPECSGIAPLTNPEIRLVDDLDRRLEWFSSEMDPGRKPFNFCLLHNHWLNRRTWSVLDPPCRVDSDKRRQYGDSRFNRPLPAPQSRVRPKYLAPARIKADTPRLDSWRLAVNKERKSSGMRNFLNAAELFEGSVDEPAPGAVDPASWILKRPPQGIEPSAKQKDAYYEGCGGWCEKLDDWKNVGRAYRVRKVVFEGKAHRTRAMELARSVSGGCRAMARKVTPVWAHNAWKDTDPEKRQRRERSGRGYHPGRGYHDEKPVKPTGVSLGPMLSTAVTASADQTGDDNDTAS